jgi:hypothetical protein
LRRAREQVELDMAQALARQFDWMWRQIYVKVHTLDQQRPRIAKLYLPMHKIVISDDLWQAFQTRLESALTDAITNGVVTFDQIHAAYNAGWTTGPEQHIDSDEFADSHHAEIGSKVAHIAQATQNAVSSKILAFYHTPGMTLQTLVDDLKNDPQTGFGVARAKLIASNEVTWANSAVVRDTMTRMGATEWWWQTMRDEVVCKRPITTKSGAKVMGCRALHGQTFSINQPMPPEGSHIGCRCTPVIILPKQPVLPAQTPPTFATAQGRRLYRW